MRTDPHVNRAVIVAISLCVIVGAGAMGAYWLRVVLGLDASRREAERVMPPRPMAEEEEDGLARLPISARAFRPLADEEPAREQTVRIETAAAPATATPRIIWSPPPVPPMMRDVPPLQPLPPPTVGQPVDEPGEGEPEEEGPPAATVAITAASSGPEGVRVLVEDLETKKSQWAGEGDQAFGYRVAGVTARGGVLVKEGRAYALRLGEGKTHVPVPSAKTPEPVEPETGAGPMAPPPVQIIFPTIGASEPGPEDVEE